MIDLSLPHLDGCLIHDKSPSLLTVLHFIKRPIYLLKEISLLAELTMAAACMIHGKAVSLSDCVVSLWCYVWTPNVASLLAELTLLITCLIHHSSLLPLSVSDLFQSHVP